MPSFFQRTDTGRLQARKLLHNQLAQYFNVSELEQLAFDIDLDTEQLGYEDNDKDSLVRAMIVASLNHGSMIRLVQAASKARPFLDWPEEW